MESAAGLYFAFLLVTQYATEVAAWSGLLGFIRQVQSKDMIDCLTNQRCVIIISIFTVPKARAKWRAEGARTARNAPQPRKPGAPWARTMRRRMSLKMIRVARAAALTNSPVRLFLTGCSPVAEAGLRSPSQNRICTSPCIRLAISIR